MIDITGLDKAEVLAALYDHSYPFGNGKRDFVPGPLDVAEARELMAQQQAQYPGHVWEFFFDYVKGRLVKVNLKTNSLDPHLFDRAYGEGAAAAVIAELRSRTLAPAG